MKRYFIDSDVFVRDLRYPRDVRSEVNRRFLQKVKSKRIRGVTSIFNLLEVCGILSFNLSPEDLLELYGDFTTHYNVQVLFPADASGMFDYDISKIFLQIQKKQSLGDAQVSYVINRFSEQLRGMVSWNAVHFSGRISVPTMTPEEILRKRP